MVIDETKVMVWLMSGPMTDAGGTTASMPADFTRGDKWADGAVRYESNTVHLNTWRRLSSIADGQPLGDF